MTQAHDDHATLDKAARGCNTPSKIKKEETMTINRRDLALSTLAVSTLAVSALALTTPALAASADEEAVAKKVEAFRLAQIASDPKALGALCWDDLSYSHSNGKVEDKATFVTNATDGKSKFLSIEYQDPTIKVVGPAAIVRFHWVAEQEMVADGKKVPTNLHILMNWQKQGDDWKLLSRAATKL
jgi:ketosteroid isomerase-like protein